MTSISERANSWLADFNVNGVPASESKDPPKAEGRALFAALDALMASLGSGLVLGGAVVYATRGPGGGTLYNDLAHPAGFLGVVYADATEAYNGVYVKSGASGSGAWTITDLLLPASFTTALTAVTEGLADEITDREAAITALSDAMDAAIEAASAAQATALAAEAAARTAGDTAGATSLAARILALRQMPGVPYVRLDFVAEEYGPNSLASMLDGTPRLDTEEGTGHAIGARCEEARVNHSWSTDGQGAVVGVVGSGGLLPYGWHTANSVGGLTETILNIQGGAVDLQLTGVPTATGVWPLQFEPITEVAVTPGQELTGGVAFQVVEAPTGVDGYLVSMIERDAGGGFVSRHSENLGLNAQADDLWPSQKTHTVVSGAKLTHSLDVAVTIGVAVDVILRIQEPQLEPGGFRTSYIPSEEGEGEREADALTLIETDQVFDAFPWTAVTLFRPGPAPSSTVRQQDDGTSANRYTLLIEGNVAKLEVVAASTVLETLILGPVARWGIAAVALTVQPGLIRACLNGGVVKTSTVTGPTPTRDCLGFGAEGSLNGWIENALVYRRRLATAAELQALSIPPMALIDAFERGNRALIGDTAPTGQVYGGVEAGENPAVVAMTITDYRAVALASGNGTTAAYFGGGVGGPPRGFRALGVFAVGADANDGLALISDPHGTGDVADVTDDSAHMVFGLTNVAVGYFNDGGPLTFVDIPNYSAALAADGVTLHPIGFRLNGDAVTIEMPGGSLRRYVDPILAAQVGSAIIAEIYRNAAGAPQASFACVHAEL